MSCGGLLPRPLSWSEVGSTGDPTSSRRHRARGAGVFAPAGSGAEVDVADEVRDGRAEQRHGSNDDQRHEADDECVLDCGRTLVSLAVGSGDVGHDGVEYEHELLPHSFVSATEVVALPRRNVGPNVAV